MKSWKLLKVPTGSPLLHWEPRARLLSLLVLSFAISLVDQVKLLPWMLVMTGFFIIKSQVSLKALLSRLGYPSLLIVALVGLLPFVAEGRVLVQWGGVSLTREGLEAALLIAVRFFCIVSLSLLFLGVVPLLVHIRAARSLGVPDLITDLALLVVRHLEILSTDWQQMRKAMRLRGDAAGFWQRLNTRAWLLGSLLLRSHERSRHVYQAMRLRGYGAATPNPVNPSSMTAQSQQMTVWVFFAALSLFTLQFGWPS